MIGIKLSSSSVVSTAGSFTSEFASSTAPSILGVTSSWIVFGTSTGVLKSIVLFSVIFSTVWGSLITFTFSNCALKSLKSSVLLKSFSSIGSAGATIGCSTCSSGAFSGVGITDSKLIVSTFLLRDSDNTIILSSIFFRISLFSVKISNILLVFSSDIPSFFTPPTKPTGLNVLFTWLSILSTSS